jgi:hypothetical protein
MEPKVINVDQEISILKNKLSQAIRESKLPLSVIELVLAELKYMVKDQVLANALATQKGGGSNDNTSE